MAHAEEADAVFEERGYHHFVGGIDDAGHIAASVHGFISQGEVAEPLRIGLFERQAGALGKVETVESGVDTVGIRESVLDGQTHIGMPNCAFTAPSSNCTIE